jgi:hypothetical protein
MKKNTEAPIDASKEADLEVNVEKTKYADVLSQELHGKIETYRQLTDPFKEVKFIYLGMPITDQNVIHEEI